MLLVADIGNTNVVLGLYDGERLAASFRLSTGRPRTSDEFYIDLVALLRTRELLPALIHDAVLGSVVPPVMPALERMCRDYLRIEPLVVGPGIKTGLPIRYDNPREVGADRIVNSVAAFERVRDACVVVDLGTATTFDCVSHKGEYLGGVIAPGIQISSEALFRSTAKLPKMDIARPGQVVGRSTGAAIQAGLYFGYLGLIDGILGSIKAEMGTVRRVLATGGLAELFVPGSAHIDELAPDLTLEGMRILYYRNRA
jgi:type III pantothenate kinase